MRHDEGMTHQQQRVLLVHAHPDDEALWTGTAIAHHVDAGDDVTVVTCTLGEEGEVIPAELAHLEGDGPALAAHRVTELAGSAAALGFRSVLLGDDGSGRPRWRDSGMAGTPPFEHPLAFANRDPREPGAEIARVVREVRPDVVVTYDPAGGYLHPDHVQAHRATVAALASLPDAERPRLLCVVVPESWAQEDREWVRSHVDDGAVVVPGADDPYPPSVVPDALVSHRVEHPTARTVAALRAHPTQVTVHDGWYTLSNDIAARLPGRDAFVECDPATGRPLAGEWPDLG